MKLFPALILCMAAAPAMAGGWFLESRNHTSQRFAVFEDDEKVAYLYLTKPGSQQPERDAIAYTRVAPVDSADFNSSEQRGRTPLLTKDLASRTARVDNPAEREFSFAWSGDGNAVALLRNGEPIAFASALERFGYSKAVRKSSKLVNAWDQARYDALFAAPK